jgi:S1-C subfamily serine protease
MANRWYYKAEDTIVGPVDDSQLERAVKSGTINRSSRVRLGEEGPWGPASMVSGLFSAAPTAPPTLVPAEELIELDDDLLSELEIDPLQIAVSASLAPAKCRSLTPTPANQWRFATVIAGALATLLVVISSLVWFLTSVSNPEEEGGATAGNSPQPAPASSVTESNLPPAPASAAAPAAPLKTPNKSSSPDTKDVLYLSDLKEMRHEVWEYHPGFGFGTNGKYLDGEKEKSIVLGGIPSPKGILAHPKANGVSRVVYDLNGRPFKYFQAMIGVNDERRYGPHTPLIFEVMGDGKLLWQSKPVKRWGQPQLCSIALPTVSKLELLVRCPGDASFAFAVWCEPMLTNEAPSAQPTNSLPTQTASDAPLPQKGPGAPAPTPQNKLDLVGVVSKVERSVVRIDTDAGQGSGVVVSDDGAVLTTFHVIEGAKRVIVGLRSGKEIESQGYLAVDRLHDLAVIATETLEEGTAITISSTMPKTGETVAAFGNPKGLSFTTSEGIVSAIRGGHELIKLLGQAEYSRLGYGADATWIQTTAPISAGNSGGPLVNMNAELVGLNTMSVTKGQNLNFAISATDVTRMRPDQLAGKAPNKFDQLPSRLNRPAAAAAKQEDVTLTLPTGRVFSFALFNISSGEFNKVANASTKDVILMKYPNGSSNAAIHQLDGLLHGVAVAQWENKQPMMHATYVKGKRHGIVKAWDEAGKPVFFGQYTQNRKQGFFCFFEDGTFRLLTQYKAEKPEYLQLMLGGESLDGFDSIEKAKQNPTVRDLLAKTCGRTFGSMPSRHRTWGPLPNRSSMHRRFGKSRDAGTPGKT